MFGVSIHLFEISGNQLVNEAYGIWNEKIENLTLLTYDIALEVVGLMV